MTTSTLCLIGIPITAWAITAGARYFDVFFFIVVASSNVPAAMGHAGERPARTVEAGISQRDARRASFGLVNPEFRCTYQKKY
ncbi:hypothetical protein HDV57DRAFT_517895 [Trichoderma longibrachiatum]